MKTLHLIPLAAAVAASIVAAQPAATPVGRYVATLPAADSPGRALLLILTAEHTARLTIDYKNGKPPIADSGNWKTAEDRVVVTLTRRGTKALPKPRVLTFTASGDTLTAVDPNPKEWGSAGLTLTRDLAGGLIGGTWHMTKAVHGNDPPVVPKDPSNYTAQFGDGRHAVAAGGLQPRPRLLLRRPAEAARRARGDHADDVPARIARHNLPSRLERRRDVRYRRR